MNITSMQARKMINTLHLERCDVCVETDGCISCPTNDLLDKLNDALTEAERRADNNE
jgi:hypothetical protein